MATYLFVGCMGGLQAFSGGHISSFQGSMAAGMVILTGIHVRMTTVIEMRTLSNKTVIILVVGTICGLLVLDLCAHFWGSH